LDFHLQYLRLRQIDATDAYALGSKTDLGLVTFPNPLVVIVTTEGEEGAGLDLGSWQWILCWSKCMDVNVTAAAIGPKANSGMHFPPNALVRIPMYGIRKGFGG